MLGLTLTLRGMHSAEFKMRSFAAMAAVLAMLPAGAFAAAGNLPLNRTAAARTNAKAAPVKTDHPFRPAQIGYVIFVENQPKLLAQKLPRLVLRQITLNQAIKRMAALTGENFAVGWPALKRAGIAGKKPHDVTLPAATCRRDLAGLFRVFARHKRLVISADENVIFITTEAQDDQRLILRTYWLPDILANLPRIIPPAAILQRMRHPGKGPHHKAVWPAGYTPGQSKKKRRQPVSTDLISLITNAVRPKIWANHGGNATMTEVGNKVIVDAPASVQALLAGPSHYHPNAVPRFFMIGL